MRKLREFWDRYGASVVLVGIFMLFVGLFLWSAATEREIDEGYDKPMVGGRR